MFFCCCVSINKNQTKQLLNFLITNVFRTGMIPIFFGLGFFTLFENNQFHLGAHSAEKKPDKQRVLRKIQFFSGVFLIHQLLFPK